VAAAAEQQQRVIENPFVSVLEHVLHEKDEMQPEIRDKQDRIITRAKWVEGAPMQGKITTEAVWLALGVRAAQRTQAHNENMGSAMRTLGFEKTRLRAYGSLGYCYVRGPRPYRQIVIAPGSDGFPASASYKDE
jgi:hypothetical protein